MSLANMVDLEESYYRVVDFTLQTLQEDSFLGVAGRDVVEALEGRWRAALMNELSVMRERNREQSARARDMCFASTGTNSASDFSVQNGASVAFSSDNNSADCVPNVGATHGFDDEDEYIGCFENAEVIVSQAAYSGNEVHGRLSTDGARPAPKGLGTLILRDTDGRLDDVNTRVRNPRD